MYGTESGKFTISAAVCYPFACELHGKWNKYDFFLFYLS